VAWAGVGLMLPWRLLGAGPLRWTVRRILSDPSFAQGAEEFASWSRTNDGAERGAELLGQFLQ